MWMSLQVHIRTRGGSPRDAKCGGTTDDLV